MLKDKKISIVTLQEGKDEDGYPTGKELKPIPGGENIWAYYRHSTGKEFYEAAKINVKVEAIFVINWRNDITISMQIKYKNELYKITQIDDFEGYKRELKIYAYKVD
ncbi:hypothetical protein UT300018_10550 [Clostridium faecium]